MPRNADLLYDVACMTRVLLPENRILVMLHAEMDHSPLVCYLTIRYRKASRKSKTPNLTWSHILQPKEPQKLAVSPEPCQH